jgi:ribonuclease P protein subunit POP4
MITPQNVLRHELMGLPVEVVRSTGTTFRGVRGVIAGETRNMLAIRTERGIKHIPKMTCTFRLALPGGSVVDVDGSALVSQPEKRITTRMRR